MFHFYKTGTKNFGRRENRVFSEEQIAEKLYENLQAVARMESGKAVVEKDTELSKRLRDNMGMYLI